MIKKVVFSIFGIISFASFCFAGDLTIPDQNWQFMPQPVYDIVPTRQERLEDPDFTRFPDWQDMEIARREVINQELASQVQTGLWHENIPPMEGMRDLVLQAFDILVTGIQYRCSTTMIPFATDIRYREAGLLDWGWTSSTHQGTINSFGIIQVTLGDEKEAQDIKILFFDDSKSLERFGRQKLGTIDQYDINFVKSIVYPLLRKYLSKDENKEKLLEFIDLSKEGSRNCW